MRPFAFLALLLLPCAAGAVEVSGAPEFASKTKGAAAAPRTGFKQQDGRAAITIDAGELEGEARGGLLVTAALEFTVGPEGETVRVRRSFAADLLLAAVKGDVWDGADDPALATVVLEAPAKRQTR